MLINIDTTSEDFARLTDILSGNFYRFDIDDIKHSKELCIIYAMRESSALSEIPKKYLDDNIRRTIIAANPEALFYIEDWDNKPELIKIALSKNGYLMRKMPLSIRKNSEMIEIAMKSDYNSYKYISKIYRRKQKYIDLFFSELEKQDGYLSSWGHPMRYLKTLPYEKIKKHVVKNSTLVMHFLPQFSVEDAIKSLDWIQKEVGDDPNNHYNKRKIKAYQKKLPKGMCTNPEFAHACLEKGLTFFDFNSYVRAEEDDDDY